MHTHIDVHPQIMNLHIIEKQPIKLKHIESNI